jgi:dTDP-4-amino-4,6-dideoxygalactose transaminase
MNWKIPLADTDLGPEEEAAVLAVLRRGWLTMGEETGAFEEEFAAFTGTKHAIAVTNCTAALHLACLALELGPGDDVIVPSLSFVATANAVRYTGAAPVFADIVSEDDPCISPEDIAAKITERTRAIIVMHYAGYACDMPRILAIAQQHEITVIEDAAHAPGATLDGRALGTWGAVGCYSFFSNKNMATGEGGMLVTGDEELALKLRNLRSHGMTTVTWDRHKGHAWSYDVIDAGYNYRIDDLRAAIGRVQLQKLAANNARRQKLNEQYLGILQELVPGVKIPFEHHRGTSSYHIRPILLPPGCDRRQFMDAMKRAGIQTSIHYPPIHQFTDYRRGDNSINLPVTKIVAAGEVTLPLYPHLSPKEVTTIVNTTRAALREQHMR